MGKVPVALAMALLGGCGYVGDPLPPALNIPEKVADLRVTEIGADLIVDFTLPKLTGEGLVIRTLGTIDLRIGPLGDQLGKTDPIDRAKWAETAKAVEVKSDGKASVRKTIPAKDWAGQEVVIAVRTSSLKGRTSDWSNLVTLAVVKPLAKPVLTLASSPEGARAEWAADSAASKYRVFRKDPDAAADAEPKQLAEVDSAGYSDATAEYGKKYEYTMVALHGDARSEMSEKASITPVDTFPPAVPGGLKAILGINTVELAWERVTDSDLRGYRVYRSTDGGAFERLTEMVDTPAFSDKKIEAGKKYAYSVTAVDLRGNESARPPVSELTTTQ